MCKWQLGLRRLIVAAGRTPGTDLHLGPAQEVSRLLLIKSLQ
jgi:hypothetical protein